MSAPETFDAFGNYFDGETALLRRVGLRLEADRLLLVRPDGKRIDWPLAALRALPDQADKTGLVLGLAEDPVVRLVVADAALIARIRAAAPALKRRPPVARKGRIAAWGLGALSSVFLIIFVLVPVMADQLARWLPVEGEQALGDATFEQVRNALGTENFLPVAICDAPAGEAALDAMLARLDVADELPYPVELTVLDHEMVNAFALPGGRIVVFRGLIDEAQNPDEVAAVLAHEIGHVAGRDPTRDALRLAGSVGVLGLIFGDFAGGTVVLALTNQLINASYSQKAEAGADDYAHALLTRADLPPSALGTYFERLRDEYGDTEGIEAHFSTHPQMTARIEAALSAQAEAEASGHPGGTPSLDETQWQDLRAICGTPREPSQSDSVPVLDLSGVAWDAGMGAEVGKESGHPGTPGEGAATTPGALGGGKAL